MSSDILEQLTSSQQIMTAMLRLDAEDSTVRIGAWTLRDIAAHLAFTERDCYEPRVRAIASGQNPRFELFTHDGADFSGIHLEEALELWAEARARLIDYVRSLDGEGRTVLTGRHGEYGEVTVDRYLQIALKHDRDHLQGLERLAGELTR